jgi:DAK2 domain fusion protein YloV
MLAELDASGVRRWCHASAEAMAACRAEIDDLNVYPVPDGDTGTNMALTLRQAAEAVSIDQSATAGGVVRAMARGAVLGARGNSGVILSQVLRGLADGLNDAVTVNGHGFATAMRAAATAAWGAVANPVEGTILSVAKGAASAAEVPDESAGLGEVVSAALAGAAEALRRTPEQLDVLARAGVVDAGGRGLVVVLDALASIVTGLEVATGPIRVGPRSRSILESAREAGSAEFQFEVQYLLHAEESKIGPLRTRLTELGDSIAVVGTGDGLFNVHVHANDVGAAIEAGVEAGRPHRITVIRFADQMATAEALDRAGTAVVAIAPGEGLADLFRSEGVHVVAGGQTDNPSTEEILNAIIASKAANVVVLPNVAAGVAVAEVAAEEARSQGIQVAVISTKSPVQGLAAIAVHDPSRRFEADVISMAEAAAHTRFAEVTTAVRESITIIGTCQAGDVLGLIDGEVAEIGGDITSVGCHLVGRLVRAGGELVTILHGGEPGAQYAAEAVAAWVGAEFPLVEVAVFDGGQPHYPLLIGVE